MKKLYLSLFAFSLISFNAISQPPPPSGNYPFGDDFESYQGFGSIITDWTGSVITLQAYVNHGTNSSKGMSREITSLGPNTIFIETPIISTLPSANFSDLTFDYRIMSNSLYPLTAATYPTDASIVVSVGVNEVYTTVYTISTSNHIESTGFMHTTIPLNSFQGSDITVKIFVNKGTVNSLNEYWVDIDNFSVANEGTATFTKNENTNAAIFANSNRIFVNQENFESSLSNTLDIFDISGKKVNSFTIDKANYSSPILNLKSGVYIVSVSNNKGRTNKRITIN